MCLPFHFLNLLTRSRLKLNHPAKELTSSRTYSTWSAAHTPVTPEQTTGPITPSYPASAISLDTYLQTSQAHPILASPHTQSPSSNAAMSAPPIPGRNQHQYTFSSSAAPAQQSSGAPIRFVDSNPRPSKSPRHVAPPELPAHSYADYGTRFAAPYNGTGTSSSPLVARTSEYFPTSMSMPPWTSGTESGGSYGTTAQQLPPPIALGQQQQQQQHYDFPTEGGYVKDDSGVTQGLPQPQQHHQPHYTWSQS